MNGNLIIKNASQLVTCSGFKAKTGSAMNDLQVVENGALVIEDGLITAVGRTEDIFYDPVESAYVKKGFDVIDAAGRAVLPGFVDSHTHFVFGGFRAEEFSWRLSGMPYMEIMKRGGGIANTVDATREASKAALIESGRKRLDSMLSFGVTTVEGKSGYGLDAETEIKQLEVMEALHKIHPVDVVSTYMGAHAVPEPYKGREDDYIDYMLEEVMPVISHRGLAEFCDIFCEKNVFSIDQSRRFLRSAEQMGFRLKLHADEIVPLGGTELAAALGAVSADHLLHASDKGIAELADAGVVATLLPATAFSLKEPYARARAMIDAGCAVALATDFNPGSCFTESIPLLFALATLYMDMTTEEAVTALTLNGAAALNREAVCGSIDIGKQGDVIILDSPSYHFLSYHIGVNTVEKVIKKGVPVYDRHRP